MTKETQISDINQEEFGHFLEHLKAIWVERKKNATQEVMEGYWEIGDEIIREMERTGVNNRSKFVKCIATFLNKSDRTIYQAIQTREYCKTKEDLPDMSWFQFTQKVLPNPREVPECEHLWEEDCKTRCKKCKKLKEENKEV